LLRELVPRYLFEYILEAPDANFLNQDCQLYVDHLLFSFQTGINSLEREQQVVNVELAILI